MTQKLHSRDDERACTHSQSSHKIKISIIAIDQLKETLNMKFSTSCTGLFLTMSTLVASVRGNSGLDEFVDINVSLASLKML